MRQQCKRRFIFAREYLFRYIDGCVLLCLLEFMYQWIEKGTGITRPLLKMSCLCTCVYFVCSCVCTFCVYFVYVHVGIHVCIHVCLYMCVHVFVHVCVHVCVHMHVHVFVHACVHVCVCVCVFTCTQARLMGRASLSHILHKDGVHGLQTAPLVPWREGAQPGCQRSTEDTTKAAQ